MSEVLFNVYAASLVVDEDLETVSSFAIQSQACRALSGLKCLLDHSLPLIIRDVLGPGRDTQCRQIDGSHGPFHQLDVI